MSFLEKIKSSRSELLYLVRGKDKGEKCWHYVMVDKFKLPLFKEKLKTGSLDVADFGQILQSGWGENPPEDIVAKIKAEYS